MFMFQWPKLPEIMFSMSDYKFLQDCFTKPREVCKALCYHYFEDVMKLYTLGFEEKQRWLHCRSD